VFLEGVPNADFDLMEHARRLNDEMAVKSISLGGDVEGVVEVGFVLWEVVAVDVDIVAVGKGDVGFVELHFGKEERNQVGGVPSASRNIEAENGGIGVNAIGKGRVNCLESSSSGGGKNGHGRNNRYVA
jgi:hypothetical protein